MMKNLFTKAALLLIVSLGAVALVSCSDDEDPAVLKSKAEGMNFTSGTYSKSLPVEAVNVSDWTVDVQYSGSETGWVTAEKKAGAVLVKVEPNSGSTARSATLILSAQGVPDVSVPVSQKAKFSSPLVGTYTPNAMASDFEKDYYGFRFYAKWDEQKGAPTLTLGSMELNWDTIAGMLPMMVGAIYLQGLVSVELLDDGRIIAKYHEISFENGITDPSFGKETLTFPDAVTMPEVPVDVVTYYSQNSQIYLAADKYFIKQVDPGTLGVPICSYIDGLIAKYSLPVVSDTGSYALPLKYTLGADNNLLIYIDRTMMLPFKQVLVDLIKQYLPALTADEGGSEALDPQAITDFVGAVFDNSTEFELGIHLMKQA